MAQKKHLITKTQHARINEIAKRDPERAMRELQATVAIRRAADFARDTAFSIDAIQPTKKRRTPLQHTGTLDQEFGGENNRDTLIQTSRDLFLNHSFANGMLKQHVKNVIGKGPMLQAQTGNEDFDNACEAYWHSRKDRLDVRGLSFEQNLRVGESREVVDGDYGTVLVQGNRTQYIEGDRIKNPPDEKMRKDREYVGGVEMTRDGIPVAYHVWNRSGKTKLSSRTNMVYGQRIIAENFIHSYRPERFDQARGMAWVTSAVNDMQDLREVMEAAKGKWKIENMLGVAITSTAPEQSALSSLWGDLNSYTTSDSDGNDETRYQVKLDQGVHSFELRPDEDIKTIESKTPNNNFEPFTLLLTRWIALTLGMPLEVALQYFTRGSYSAHRSAFLQYYDAAEMRRSEIEQSNINRLYRWTIFGGLKRGDIQKPEGVIDPTAHVWQWPGLPILDPDKRRRGDTLGYKLGAESLSDITSRDGNYWQDVSRKRIKEVKWIIEQCEAEGVDPSRVLPAVLDPGQEVGGNDARNDDE